LEKNKRFEHLPLQNKGMRQALSIENE